MPTVKLSTGKRRHLVSVYATVCHMLQQMEETARDGRSPTGMGAPLTPLPQEQAEAILAPLRRLKQRLHQIAQELSPRELASLEVPQSLKNTLVWQSNLLDRIRNAVDDLHPRRVRRYGELDDEEGTLFEAIHRELLHETELSRASLEAQMRKAGEGTS